MPVSVCGNLNKVFPHCQEARHKTDIYFQNMAQAVSCKWDITLMLNRLHQKAQDSYDSVFEKNIPPVKNGLSA